MVYSFCLPSGKRLHNYGNHHFLAGKIHYFYGPFSIAILTQPEAMSQK